MNLIEERKRVNTLLGNYRVIKKQYQEEKINLEKVETQKLYIEEAQQITQTIAQSIQQQAHDKIAPVVTHCLRIVFNEPYIFNILFERKRGRTEARLVFEKEGHQIDPLSADAGGLVDVAAYALRLCCLVLSKPALRKLLLLDEPFKNISAEYLENAKLLLEGMSRDFGIQQILITHINELKTGKVISL